jgi:hypothetical protein
MRRPREFGVIVLVGLIIICALIYLYLRRITRERKERFDIAIPPNATIAVYTANMLNDMGWIPDTLNIDAYRVKYRGITDTNSWNTLNKLLLSGNPTALLSDPGSSSTLSTVLMIADPIYTDILATKYQVIGTSPVGYFVAFGSTYNAYYMDCSFNIANKTIGYIGQYDFRFINAILHAYRIDPTTIVIKQIQTKDLNNLSSVLNDIDIVFTFLIPNSPLNKVLASQNIGFMGFKDLDVDRVRLFYAGLNMTSVNIKDTFLNKDGLAALVKDSENDTMLPTLSMKVLKIVSSQDAVNTQNTETFISRLSLSSESLDPAYRCYGDLNIETKPLCDSPYDIMGEAKTRHTKWDRPCLQDSDCPYFQANNNYSNSRGGCMDSGVCELPVGVRRVSYRTYDDTGVFAPFCYGCDAYDTACCSKSSSPDYAFANDTADRSSDGLPTIIPM